MTTCPNCGLGYEPQTTAADCPDCRARGIVVPSDLSRLAAREQGIKVATSAVGSGPDDVLPFDPRGLYDPIVDQPPPKPGRGDILAVQAALAQIQGLAGMLAATVDALARTIVALACEPEIEEQRGQEAEVQRLREKNDGLTRAVCGDGEQIAGLERELDDLRAENQRLKSRLAGAPWEG